MKKEISDKIPYKLLIGFGIFILGMAYLIEKDLSLPTPITLAVAVVGGLWLLFVSPSQPEMPFYLLVAYLPFNRVLPGDFGGTFALNLTNLLCALIIVGGFFRSTKQGAVWQKASLNAPIFLFMFLGAISLMHGSWEYGTWYVLQFITPLKRWLTPPLLYFMTLLVVRERRVLKTIIVIMMICVTVVGLMAIRDYIEGGTGSSIEADRIGGIAEEPNMLAAFFCYYMFILASFFLCNMSQSAYWLLLIPFLICFRGIQVTFSRGGYLSFLAGGLALSFFRNKILFVLTIVLLAAAVLNPVFLPKGIAYRINSTFKHQGELSEEPGEEPNGEDTERALVDVYKGQNVTLEASSESRLAVWRGALRIIGDYPFWGTGYGTFLSVIPFYTPELRGMQLDAHNSYLIIAAEMGLPTLFVFLWLLLLAMWKSYRLSKIAKDPFLKAMALGVLAGLFALMVANMFGSRMDQEEISGYFWILCALVMRGLSLETEARVAPATVVSKKRRNAARLITPEGVVFPHSLSASLRRFDERKYEKT